MDYLKNLTKEDRARRYWLFGYNQRYPAGAFNDLDGTFDSPSEAREFIKSGDWKCDDYDLFDMETRTEVENWRID